MCDTCNKIIPYIKLKCSWHFSLEVAIQCLENVYDLAEDGTAAKTDDHPMNNANLFDLFLNTFVSVNPERKAEAENLKNEGNRLMKEEKYHEALATYSRWVLWSMNPRNSLFIESLFFIPVQFQWMQRIQSSIVTGRLPTLGWVTISWQWTIVMLL